MTDEPTAIRHPKRGKAHRPVERQRTKWLPPITPKAACNHLTITTCWESVPLSQTAPADRCRTCWPTPKEQNA